jgi:hypothetical protein
MNGAARSPKPSFVKLYRGDGLRGNEAILYAEVFHDAELRAAGGRGLGMAHAAIMERVPISRASIQRTMRKLEQKGLIIRRTSEGGANVYEPARPFAVLNGGPQNEAPGGIKMRPPRPQNEAPPIRYRERDLERDLLPSVVSPARQAAPNVVPAIEARSTPEDLADRAPSPPTDGPADKGDTSQVNLPLFSGENPKSRPKRDRRREVTPDDLAAYAVLNALWPLVEKQVPEYAGRSKEWRQRNKAAALTIARMPPVKPDDEHNVKRATAALTFAYTDPRACEFYGTLHSLAKLLDALPRLREMAIKLKPAAPPGATGKTGMMIVR